MKERSPIPERLREHRDAERSAESRVGAVIRSMKSPERLGSDAHARILTRLRMTEHGRKWEWFGVVPRPVLAAAVAAGIVFLGVGAEAGISWIWKAGLSWMHERRQPDDIEEHGASIKPPRRELSVVVHASPSNAAPPVPTELANPPLSPVIEQPSGAAEASVVPLAPAHAGGWPSRVLASPSRAARADTPASLGSPSRLAAVPQSAADEVAGAGAPGAPPPAVAVAVSAAPAVARAPADPSPLAQESRLLSTALDQLRTNRDYKGALVTLSEYDDRFPRGALRSEAKLARLDALMGLGSADAALRLLDGIEIGGPRALEVLALRGELRAHAGRYQEAIGDFNQVLSHDAPERLHERALYGRASCFSRTGDARAAVDQREYLAKFPTGIHASEIRQNLNR